MGSRRLDGLVKIAFPADQTGSDGFFEQTLQRCRLLIVSTPQQHAPTQWTTQSQLDDQCRHCRFSRHRGGVGSLGRHPVHKLQISNAYGRGQSAGKFRRFCPDRRFFPVGGDDVDKQCELEG